MVPTYLPGNTVFHFRCEGVRTTHVVPRLSIGTAAKVTTSESVQCAAWLCAIERFADVPGTCAAFLRKRISFVQKEQIISKRSFLYL